MAAFITEVKGVNRPVHDATSKPPGTIKRERLRLGRGREFCRRASDFKGLGAKICNFRGDAYTSDAVMLRRSANPSEIKRAHYVL